MHPITPIIVAHGCDATIAESGPQHIIECIDLQQSAAQQPLAAPFTNCISPQCAHTTLRSSTTTDVTDGGQVAQSSIPPITRSRISSDRANAPCTTNRDDEDSEILSTMDRRVQKTRHAIETFARSVFQTPVRMYDQENVKPLCLHGHVESLEEERQFQTHIIDMLSTVAELAPAAPISIYSTMTESATSTCVLVDADNKHPGRRSTCERAHEAQARALIPKNKLDAMAVEERERCVGARMARNERRNSASANQNRTVQFRACPFSSSLTTTTAPPQSRTPVLKRIPAPRAETAELSTETTPSDISRAEQRYPYYGAKKLYEQRIGARYTTTNLRGATAQHGWDFLLPQHSHYTSRLR
ncbi:uncharacterized protein LAESUDRAFT_453642 [Laetiporus sulphureus 93-53]|uniref:Uncharacterized protein n=1 Tax=Laetiporus sulphureus 93-53 TaxID=1314785 RepID=A0A165BUW4_9APHY|nr:uncharacterized protein LAESUDRAFT_453642 [Laetiporus sulphureus 93-53]KZT01699.1 hypothetical protein LAESUDRAFT_453642 [Laetiporus sulphureus 93-53]